MQLPPAYGLPLEQAMQDFPSDSPHGLGGVVSGGGGESVGGGAAGESPGAPGELLSE